MGFLRDNDKQLYISFDFESCNTCLVGLKNLVWQLGVVIFQGNQVLEEHEFFIKWEPLNISKGAAQVTRFNPIEYKEKAEDPKKAFEFLTSFLYNPEFKLLGQNILGFEIYLYNNWRKIMGYDSDWSYLPRCIDTNALAKGLKNDIKYCPGQDFLAYQFRMLSIVKKGIKTNLTTLGKEYKVEGIDFNNLHRSLEDSRLTKKVWDKIKWQVEI